MKLQKISQIFMMLLLSGMLSVSPVTVQARSIDEGIEYKTIIPAVPTDVGDKVEVVELFWYMCPHCFRAEPVVNAWGKTLPKNVVFKRVPAVFQPKWAFHARVFYTAKALDVVDKIHGPLLEAIHIHKKRINSVPAMAQFFKQYAGTDPAQFEAIFNSFGVDAMVRRAVDLSKRYQVEGVPAMIVNGKYRTDATLSGGTHQTMMEVVQFLVDKEAGKK